MLCNNCGRELKDGATFCPKCGTKVQQVVQPVNIQPAEEYIFCSGCGSKMKKIAKFCPKCGKFNSKISLKQTSQMNSNFSNSVNENLGANLSQVSSDSNLSNSENVSGSYKTYSYVDPKSKTDITSQYDEISNSESSYQDFSYEEYEDLSNFEIDDVDSELNNIDREIEKNQVETQTNYYDDIYNDVNNFVENNENKEPEDIISEPVEDEKPKKEKKPLSKKQKIILFSSIGGFLAIALITAIIILIVSLNAPEKKAYKIYINTVSQELGISKDEAKELDLMENIYYVHLKGSDNYFFKVETREKEVFKYFYYTKGVKEIFYDDAETLYNNTYQSFLNGEKGTFKKI